jgi:hypothetical protein
MFKVAVGHSNDPDSLEAITEILEQCIQSLDGAMPQAGILFAAIDFEHSLILQRINETFPNIELIGGTTDGEVSSVLEFQQDSITLMLFCSDEIEIRAAIGRNVSEDPIEISRKSVEVAQQKLLLPVKFCIAMTESLTTSSVSIVRGLEIALGNLPLTNGNTNALTNSIKTKYSAMLWRHCSLQAIFCFPPEPLVDGDLLAKVA